MATNPDIQILSNDLVQALRSNPSLVQDLITPAHVIALSRKIQRFNGRFETLSDSERQACSLIDDVACSIAAQRLPTQEQFRELAQAVATVESL